MNTVELFLLGGGAMFFDCQTFAGSSECNFVGNKFCCISMQGNFTIVLF